MISKEKQIDYEMYYSMFMEYEKLGIDQLFPEIPYSSNPLLDIYKRIQQLHVYFRKKLQAEFNWTLVKFYRKIQHRPGLPNIMYDELRFSERKQVLIITIECLEKFIGYLRSEYKNEI
jgi:hypothetical protein